MVLTIQTKCDDNSTEFSANSSSSAETSKSSFMLDLGQAFATSTDVNCLQANISLEDVANESSTHVYPDELRHINMTQLISYSILFPLAAIGNLLVFIALFRNRHRKSRVNLMLLHLSLADMIVTFIFLPTEIIWHINIEWVFGNVGCKVYKYLSAFGFYISSMVLVCISLDRYFAVLHPLKVSDAQRRGKLMLFFAWMISAVLSIPQSVIFKVQSHPTFPKFRQCVTFGFFDAHEEMIYTAFVISFLYFIPLAIIVVAYTRIIVEITKKSRETKGDAGSDTSSAAGESRHPRLRRSNMSTIERARSRTLGMTFIIVLAFVWCWTPYSICTLWNFIDQDTFKRMNLHLQDILFILAVSNSVVNPIIYGRYSLSCFRKKKEGPKRKATCRNPCYFCYWICCCSLSPVAMETDIRENKLFNASGMTKSTGTMNNRSVRFNQCKYFMNGLCRGAMPNIKTEGSTPILRGQNVPPQEPELISMVHLDIRQCPSETAECNLQILTNIPEEDFRNASDSFSAVIKPNQISGVHIDTIAENCVPSTARVNTLVGSRLPSTAHTENNIEGYFPSSSLADADLSSGYSSSQHCQSFHDKSDRDRPFSGRKSPNSC